MTFTTCIRIVPLGPFDLARLALFGFGHRHHQKFDGTMRLAFVGDDHRTSCSVAVTQLASGVVECVIQRDLDSDSALPVKAVGAQIERMLSLDHDGRGFAAIAKRDPVMDQLQRLAPGLRPPLFHSPYEAAAWSIISARRNATQMTKVRASLCAEHGVAFDISGERVAAFPPPDVLRRITQFPGLDATKISRLHAVAVAASAGALDASHLSLIGADTAMTELQQIPGIGPFYATLITVRAVGFADLAPAEEPRLLAIAGRLYGTGAPMSITEFTKLSEAWAPYRTWASVLLRSTGPLLNN